MAEGGGLLNRYTVKSRIGGSNPPLSATSRFCACLVRLRSNADEFFHLGDHRDLGDLVNRGLLVRTGRGRKVAYRRKESHG